MEFRVYLCARNFKLTADSDEKIDFIDGTPCFGFCVGCR